MRFEMWLYLVFTRMVPDISINLTVLIPLFPLHNA
jgi:hypothetical protein